MLHRHFSSVSDLSQVIRDFDTFKIGPEVVLAARWRPKEKIQSPFDSPPPTLYRLSVDIFRLSLTVQKLFECVDLISYQRDPQKALPYSKPRRLSYRACKSVQPFGLYRHTRKKR